MAVVSLVAISSARRRSRCRGREDDGVAGGRRRRFQSRVTDESVCEGPLSDGVAQAAVRGERRPGGAVANQFDADEVAPTADIATSSKRARDVRNDSWNAAPVLRHPLEQPVALDDALNGEPAAQAAVSGERVSREVSAMLRQNGGRHLRRDEVAPSGM